MWRLVCCGTLVVLLVASREIPAQVSRTPASDAARRGGGDALQGPRHRHRHGGRGGHHHDDEHHHHHHGRRWDPWCDLSFFWIGGGYPPFLPYLPPYRAFGYSATLPPAVVNPRPVGGGLANLPAGGTPDPAPRTKPRTTNAEQKARAGRFIGFGDANFAKQKYVSAVERYKTATSIAPDVAETYFRQAFALVAIGRYEKAANMFRRGLHIRSDWSGSPFRLDQIYDNAPLPKTHHIESLAKAADANPFDADLMMLLGMQLFFDGQQDRAGAFFARAAQLGGNEDQLLNDFLPQRGAAAKPNAQDPGGKEKVVF